MNCSVSYEKNTTQIGIYIQSSYLALPIGVQKGGSQYSPAIYTIDIAYNIDIPLYIFDRYITGI